MFVKTNGLTKRYRNITALDECSLEVQTGEVFGLLGPNGAGKTTLIRLLLGFLKPTSGSATISDLDCYRDRVKVHRLVSYLPGDPRLFPQMRGIQVLEFFANVRPEGNFRRSKKIADRLDLDVTRRVSYMSTGMRQKLAFAAAVAAQTDLLILDEPTSNLDPTVRGVVLDLVAEAKQSGRTVMFSSHVLSEVEQVCDRVVILRKGQLVHTQIMADLRRRHFIRARLRDSLPEVPEDLQSQLTLNTNGDGEVTIETPGELSPLLGWLGTLPLDEVTVEPVGLRAVYDEFHNEQVT